MPDRTTNKPIDGGSSRTSSLLDDLVMANHILFDQNVVDAFGHVSVRSAQKSDRFFMARNMAPGQVTKEDLLEFGLDGEPIGGNGARVYLERYIHSEIYKARPEVNAVVHSHSHSIVPLSVVEDQSLRAIFHMAAFIGTKAPIFDLASIVGDENDLLISDRQRGEALVRSLEGSDIVLMRGHGSTVLGTSLQQAVFRAIYAEVNARYQLQASSLGNVKYLSEGECRRCSVNLDAQLKRPWDFWCEEATAKRR